MSAPADFPDWSSNANYSTGVDLGTPTTTTPSAGEIADGFIRLTAAVPQHVNYLMKSARAWFNYLKNLTSENLTWSGVQTFSTAWLLSGSVEGTYSAARTRRIMVPVTEFNADPASVWTFSPNGIGGGTWSASPTATPVTLVGHVRVPNGCTVTNVRVAYGGTSVADTCLFRAWKITNNRATGASTYTQLGADTAINVVGFAVADQTGAISTSFAETDLLSIEFWSGNNSSNTLQPFWAEVTFTETRATGGN